MDFYAVVTICGLLVATYANRRDVPALALVCVASLFLVLLRAVLPDPDSIPDIQQPAWFAGLCAFEMVFAGLALMTKAPAAKAISMFSAWNIIAHAVGFYSLMHLDAYDVIYTSLVRSGELFQVLSLIVMSSSGLAALKRAVNKLSRFDRKTREPGDGFGRIATHI